MKTSFRKYIVYFCLDIYFSQTLYVTNWFFLFRVPLDPLLQTFSTNLSSWNLIQENWIKRYIGSWKDESYTSSIREQTVLENTFRILGRNYTHNSYIDRHGIHFRSVIGERYTKLYPINIHLRLNKKS